MQKYDTVKLKLKKRKSIKKYFAIKCHFAMYGKRAVS